MRLLLASKLSVVTSLSEIFIAVTVMLQQAVQTIKHPSSLWHVIALPNGDFVTACQDHGARIFTR